MCNKLPANEISDETRRERHRKVKQTNERDEMCGANVPLLFKNLLENFMNVSSFWHLQHTHF